MYIAYCWVYVFWKKDLNLLSYKYLNKSRAFSKLPNLNWGAQISPPLVYLSILLPLLPFHSSITTNMFSQFLKANACAHYLISSLRGIKVRITKGLSWFQIIVMTYSFLCLLVSWDNPSLISTVRRSHPGTVSTLWSKMRVLLGCIRYAKHAFSGMGFWLQTDIY